MTFNPLTALSPLDGRYAGKVDALREHFSEFGLIKNRLKVEIEWLKALAAEPHFTEIAPFSPATIGELDALVANFGVDPTRSLFVEDMARNLKPAKAIGMTTVWVNNGSELGNHEADTSFIDYEIHDVGHWLHEITGGLE